VIIDAINITSGHNQDLYPQGCPKPCCPIPCESKGMINFQDPRILGCLVRYCVPGSVGAATRRSKRLRAVANVPEGDNSMDLIVQRLSISCSGFIIHRSSINVFEAEFAARLFDHCQPSILACGATFAPPSDYLSFAINPVGLMPINLLESGRSSTASPRKL